MSNSFVTPGIVARQTPLSMEFFRQEHWSGSPFPPPGDLPEPEIEPVPPTSPALASRFFTMSPKSLVLGLVLFSCSVMSILCNTTDCSMPGFPVHHQLLELDQTHVHRVRDAIQPISSSVPFSSCLQFFPASGSFLRSQFFASGGQSIGASASASVLPMNIQDWLPLGLTGLISLQSKGLSKVFSSTTAQKHKFFNA